MVNSDHWCPLSNDTGRLATLLAPFRTELPTARASLTSFARLAVDHRTLLAAP